MAEGEGGLAVRQAAEIDLSERRQELMRATVARELSKPEFDLFIEYVRATKLDPFRRQVYALKVDQRMTVHVGIDGLRLIAQRSGRYGGVIGPEWCGPDGKWREVWLEDEPPAAARVAVVNSDMERPVWGLAKYASFVQTVNDRQTGKPRPNRMWSRMPDHMLAKCAEALAIRRAFPAETSGLYVSMADGEVETSPKPVNPDSPSTNYQRGELHRLALALDWTEQAYRDELEALSGKRSAADLTKGQAHEVIDAWRRLEEADITEGELVDDAAPTEPEEPEPEPEPEPVEEKFDPGAKPSEEQWRHAEVIFKTKLRPRIAERACAALGIDRVEWASLTAGHLRDAMSVSAGGSRTEGV